MGKSGIFSVYKPKGMSSYDVVRVIKQVTRERCVGHGGTLDPLARGVLVIGVGKDVTRRLRFIAHEKEYVAVIRFGATSTTDDEEGEKTDVNFCHAPAYEDVAGAIQKFIGTFYQTPPKFSAVKIRGRRAYRLARAGQEFVLEPKEVLVKEIHLLEYYWPFAHVSVITGPGVYIRSLARDIGSFLSVGGYLADLERVRVGSFVKETSLSIEQCMQLGERIVNEESLRNVRDTFMH